MKKDAYWEYEYEGLYPGPPPFGPVNELLGWTLAFVAAAVVLYLS